MLEDTTAISLYYVPERTEAAAADAGHGHYGQPGIDMSTMPRQASTFWFQQIVQTPPILSTLIGHFGNVEILKQVKLKETELCQRLVRDQNLNYQSLVYLLYSATSLISMYMCVSSILPLFSCRRLPS